ncbi:glutamine--fructose-6-phosphate transaminase [Litorimonas taeanensis]|uniref:Glutamine--fructose-6-phosphate aminotransferase [isomerizing] n=1 Tax=Litorimonas taeanensis TaxID=568099 RepID=A0A420WDX9_9PROT|nr:glutamine--fructose-6-phosphate transaminase (isomerizing) [Litorimonas taeanensis]RKQ69102.1 glutamine--fructose-6-phosphate transaminase [Litorimonas taeanensis]
MCGILGIVGKTQVTSRLIDGLKRLEYRGYDSSGVALLDTGELKRVRAEGKIAKLEKALESNMVEGQTGIAHTRWATHGIPSEINAHPHIAGRVSIVHNGIIENYAELRDSLEHNPKIESETDTEIVAHLMNGYLEQGLEPTQAFSQSLKQLRGAYALGLIIDGHSDHLFCARAGSPLAIGIGEGEMFIGSDAIALEQLSKKLVYLEEGDWAILTPDSYVIFDENDKKVERPIVYLENNIIQATKGNYRHFMLKEIFEQPITIGQTLATFMDEFGKPANGFEDIDFSKYKRLFIVACGTAYYAGAVAKYWFEQVAGIPVEIDIASEFRYRQPILDKDCLFVAISQSGETADTLAALRYAKAHNVGTLALVNVTTSTMAREADIFLPINAGPEIGVASTKAFTSQLAALACFALAMSEHTSFKDKETIMRFTKALTELPDTVSETLRLDAQIEKLCLGLSSAKSVFYLGRDMNFPIALEAALKLKEISYIHAEGYAAGELKHGPIALIEPGTPVIVLAAQDPLFDKTVSNLREVSARGAKVYLITDKAGAKIASEMAEEVIILPECESFVSPLIVTIAIQLMAYHTAVHLGTDVDQPRNLAKSVTVE